MPDMLINFNFGAEPHMRRDNTKFSVWVRAMAQAARLTVAICVVMLVSAPARAQNTGAQPACADGGQATQTCSAAPESPTDPPDDNLVESMFPRIRNTRFWLSGQANFIFQTHPPFHAPYSGQNSLNPNYEKATSRVLTLYTGVRLNDSTELLVDIEEQVERR